jgi:hypothetical protein
MAVVNTSRTFTNNEQITSTKLNQIMDESSFTDDAIVANQGLQITAGGQMQIPNSGITTALIGNNQVTTAKIPDSAITTAKIANSTSTTTGITTAKIANSAVTTDKIANGNVTLAKLSGTSGTRPVQIIQSVKLDTQTITNNSTSWVDVSSLSVTITRASTTSKHRIEAVINNSSNDSDVGVMFRILRGSTAIGIASSAGNRMRTTSGSGNAGGYSILTSCIDFIDDTSAVTDASITYKIQARINSAQIGYINRSYLDPDVSDYGSRTISTITVTELG